jgi:hypothetical protein
MQVHSSPRAEVLPSAIDVHSSPRAEVLPSAIDGNALASDESRTVAQQKGNEITNLLW